jgi:peptide methionine sulfoxide reductase msrA/msrB
MHRAPVLAFASLLLLSACSGSSSEHASTAPPPNTPLERGASTAPDNQQFAYFAGGCFWGVEHYLEQMDGVLAVESGYMGGSTSNPTYDDVLTHGTGHLETVRVRFDPAKVSYHALAKRFFEIHDPTQKDGQGPDIGNQYLSAVFVVDSDQKRDTQSLIAQLRERGYDVATTVRPAGEFWIAEGYHQDYYARTGKKPYCHTRVRRFGDE